MTTSADESANAAVPLDDAAARTRALVAALWQRSQPVVAERIALLDEAARAVEMGVLTLDARTEAGSAAHKLAGSLGMFGYPVGTELARRLEVEFDRETPDATVLLDAVAALRALLFPAAEVRLTSTI